MDPVLLAELHDGDQSLAGIAASWTLLASFQRAEPKISYTQGVVRRTQQDAANLDAVLLGLQ